MTEGAPERRVYLDWNATTPPLEAALDAMRAAPWGNPSSIHTDGRRARCTIEDARAEIGQLTGTEGRDVVLTSGGTEANNLALRSLGPRIITSRIEHPSVVRVAEALETRWLRVLPSGVVDLNHLDELLETAEKGELVSVMAVNHETGVLQPLAEVIERSHRRGALVHVDGTQGWGKVSVATGADVMTIAGHKIRGPKGIGALAVRAGVKLLPLLLGGAQERGIRPGTTDAALAAGLGVAAKRACSTDLSAISSLRDRLEAVLIELGGVRVGSAPRAPHVTQCAFAGWAGAELVAALDLEGVSVSSGAACSAGTVEASPVLIAMGFRDPASAVRASLGEETSEEDLAFAIDAFRRVLARGPLGGAG